MQQLVLDASSVVGLLLDPDAEEHAIASRGSLHAPSIVPYEVSNVLRRLQGAGKLADRDAEQAFADYAALDIELWPWPTLGERVWQLRGNLSSYDAAYVALAERIDATLVTRDARLARAPGTTCAITVVA
ncbi:ribonuclease VapC9 [Agromyces luteolus]|uniref:Ribonuclease VapC n=1 Tax=Agromyces luteolus TaxID=88373 RepID=A0A7C9HWF9_9MICO|nr:type II toxin-antitoxin system VapC family toxin [Agromyces luteolus]MUN08965.1 PIN domain-containing protein [Agromyces luteolus]GLK28653.1 ribonuclease VapC9 [Agromyces luteolus]